ncbi:hypothetical protein [Amycolatopsis coloradensis]|uniref:hypothetical protein n=1 Tax=Amycolatopsis coloradensis TaxID=76021 RepID=UPI0011789A7E|nr:hypothetical protein [Amycolatopsis coloradensis]
MLNAQRMDFLDGIEDELSTSNSAGPSSRSSRVPGRVGFVASTLVTGASLLALLPGVASAEPMKEASPVTVMACSTPDPVAQFQSKWCGTANYVFNYQYNYSPNGVVRCFVFDLTIYHAPCGGTVHVGKAEACARMLAAE